MSQQRYPYDEQNAREFERITDQIHGALEQLRNDANLKATGNLLAELAGVSRGTLYKRKWPAEELKAIKAERRKAAEATAREDETDAGDTKSREEKLGEQVENLKTENALLFHDLEDARRKVESLERENKRLQSIKSKLKSRLDRAKISGRSPRPNSNLSLVLDHEATDPEDS